MDTLDHGFAGKQYDLMSLSEENMERINNQNQEEISLIIGNPPYRANQSNENENNKSRSYKELDNLIKKTYVEKSKSKKTKRYDMYSRFFAGQRTGLTKKGIIAFVTDSNYIKSSEADGFREAISKNLLKHIY